MTAAKPMLYELLNFHLVSFLNLSSSQRTKLRSSSSWVMRFTCEAMTFCACLSENGRLLFGNDSTRWSYRSCQLISSLIFSLVGYDSNTTVYDLNTNLAISSQSSSVVRHPQMSRSLWKSGFLCSPCIVSSLISFFLSSVFSPFYFCTQLVS